MKLSDIKLFTTYPIMEFEEELLLKEGNVELWACKKARAESPRHNGMINLRNSKAFNLHGYFVLIIYITLPDGKTTTVNYRTSNWNPLAITTTNYKTMEVENDRLSNLLKKFSCVNRLAAYMTKSYIKNRSNKIPSYKQRIKEYEDDRPFLDKALFSIDALKPARGSNGKLARQGKRKASDTSNSTEFN